MLSVETMKLERWETPFVDATSPSVGVVIESTEKGADILTLVVAPDGLHGYPKYLVRFDTVAAFTCREEAFAPPVEAVDHASITDRKASAYTWVGSTWVEAYRRGSDIFPALGGELRHYLVLGGDNIVEVVSSSEPEIEKVSGPRVLKTLYAV